MVTHPHLSLEGESSVFGRFLGNTDSVSGHRCMEPGHTRVREARPLGKGPAQREGSPQVPAKTHACLAPGSGESLVEKWLGVEGAKPPYTNRGVEGAEPPMGVEGAKPLSLDNTMNKSPQRDSAHDGYRLENAGKILKSVRDCLSGTKQLRLTHRYTGEIKSVPFRCNSWRCPECSKRVSRQWYARVRDAVAAHPGKYAFLVITLPPATRNKYSSVESAYRDLEALFNKLIKRMTREYGKVIYVSTVEQHVDGWPHMNVVFRIDEFSQYKDDDELKRRFGNKWLRKALLQSGFGFSFSLSFAKNLDAVAKYISKNGMDHTIGEIVKRSQAPLRAPRGFRRLRSSKGFLPPRQNRKISVWIGEIVNSPLNNTESQIEPCYDHEDEEVEEQISSSVNINPNMVVNHEKESFPGSGRFCEVSRSSLLYGLSLVQEGDATSIYPTSKEIFRTTKESDGLVKSECPSHCKKDFSERGDSCLLMEKATIVINAEKQDTRVNKQFVDTKQVVVVRNRSEGNLRSLVEHLPLLH